MNRTQPSPCKTATKHDYGNGNHRRSAADNSIVCVHPELCRTESVRYMMSSKLDLYRGCMDDLKAAVSATVYCGGGSWLYLQRQLLSSVGFQKEVPFGSKRMSTWQEDVLCFLLPCCSFGSH